MKATAMEILLLIKNDRSRLYYDRNESTFTYDFMNPKELKRILKYKKKEELQIDDMTRNIELPSFDEINHESIMRLFVKDCVEDKKIRMELFYILRRYDYVTPFIDKLKELGLYDDFDTYCGSLYNQILKEWAEDNGIDLYKKK